jgi:hypothetical protein
MSNQSQQQFLLDLCGAPVRFQECPALSLGVPARQKRYRPQDGAIDTHS